MNKDLKKALSAAFEAPPPQKKRAFFRNVPLNYVNHFSFLLSQAGYIRKTTWALSVAVLALAVAAGRYAPRDAMWVMAALMPFAALTAVSESSRSSLHGMEELELAARFSLKSVIMARMGLIGLAHLVLFCLLAPLARSISGVGLIRTAVYLITPYLLTTLLGLTVVRRVRGREGLYVCGGVSLLVGGLNAALQSELYAPERFPWWLAVLALLAVFTGREYYNTIKKTEELSWSL